MAVQSTAALSSWLGIQPYRSTVASVGRLAKTDARADYAAPVAPTGSGYPQAKMGCWGKLPRDWSMLLNRLVH